MLFLTFSRKGEWEQTDLNKHPALSINNTGWETQVCTGCINTGWEMQFVTVINISQEGKTLSKLSVVQIRQL